jgi:glycosyltransferase involved in cell wall biosynthesis
MVARPTISIITASFNSAKDLPKLLDSLRGQTDRDFGCTIIDGESTDHSWNIIESSNDVVTRSIREPDHGIYDALNKGIRSAATDYYLVCGADDLLYPTAIENFRKVIRESDADIVVAAVRANNVTRRGFHRHRSWLGHAAMVTSHSVGMLIRSSLHDRFGYYSLRYPMLADGYFIKLACNAPDVAIIAADFVAGEFGMQGNSNSDIVQVLCESWQIQMNTGENRLLSYLLFQCRLLKNLPQILRRRTAKPGG